MVSELLHGSRNQPDITYTGFEQHRPGSMSMARRRATKEQ